MHSVSYVQNLFTWSYPLCSHPPESQVKLVFNFLAALCIFFYFSQTFIYSPTRESLHPVSQLLLSLQTGDSLVHCAATIVVVVVWSLSGIVFHFCLQDRSLQCLCQFWCVSAITQEFCEQDCLVYNPFCVYVDTVLTSTVQFLFVV